MTINNRYTDLVQTRCLILLVNDNHEDHTLKDFLVYVYLGLIGNSRSKYFSIFSCYNLHVLLRKREKINF